MGRPLRNQQVGVWYHITDRGNERRAIYRDERDRKHFLELLGQMAKIFGIKIHAYVLMDNHYHLIVSLTESNLSAAMHWLNSQYAKWFNKRHRRSGHFYERRFKSVIVDPIQWGLPLSRYVNLNVTRVGELRLGKKDRQVSRAGGATKPDRALVAARLKRLREYEWSSYLAFIGLRKQPEWLDCEGVLELGGGKPEEQRRNYRIYVESAIREGLEISPWEELKDNIVLGGEAFLEKVREKLEESVERKRAAVKMAGSRPTFAQMLACVEKVKDERWAAFRDRHGDSGRDMVLFLAQRVCGLKVKEVAAAAGMRNCSAVVTAITRFKRRLAKNRGERKQLEGVCKILGVEI